MTDAPDEQAAPEIASAATIVRKKRLDVMRSSLFRIWKVMGDPTNRTSKVVRAPPQWSCRNQIVPERL
jgi:hypothetical protein